MDPDLNINAKNENIMLLKEARHKRLHTEWFQFYKIPELEKYTVTETRLVVSYLGPGVKMGIEDWLQREKIFRGRN